MIAGTDSTATTTTTLWMPIRLAISDEYMGTSANTPLVTDALVTKVTGNFPFRLRQDGGITLLEAVSGGPDIKVDFQFHVADHYAG